MIVIVGNEDLALHRLNHPLHITQMTNVGTISVGDDPRETSQRDESIVNHLTEKAKAARSIDVVLNYNPLLLFT
jgi:hypothetical protein